jgi:HK97 family phage major capsid protein
LDKDELKKLTDGIAEGIRAIREKNELLEKNQVNQDTKQNEMKEAIEAATKKLDEMEVIQKKIHVSLVDKEEKSPRIKAFLDWVRKGEPIPEEHKVMRISDQTLGGYLSTPEISNELLKDVVEFSPMRPIVRVRPTSKESVKIRKRTGTFSAQWTGEVETKTESTGLTYGMEEIPTHELYAFVDVSNWDLEDSDFDLESELRMEFSEQFGVAEGAATISGNAVKKPEGLLTNASIASVKSGDANLLKADGIFGLYFGPKTVYAKSAKFVMNRKTMLAASILKNAVDGTYLLRRLGESPVWNILGSEVVEAKDMPDVAAGTYPILFGNFKKAYILVDRLAMAILRDPYTQATNNSVRFHARKRLGGQVVQAEAVYKQLIGA